MDDLPFKFAVIREDCPSCEYETWSFGAVCNSHGRYAIVNLKDIDGSGQPFHESHLCNEHVLIVFDHLVAHGD